MMKSKKEAQNSLKRMLVDFINKTNYTCDIVAFDELTDFINDMQWSKIKVSNEVEKWQMFL